MKIYLFLCGREIDNCEIKVYFNVDDAIYKFYELLYNEFYNICYESIIKVKGKNPTKMSFEKFKPTTFKEDPENGIWEAKINGFFLSVRELEII